MGSLINSCGNYGLCRCGAAAVRGAGGAGSLLASAESTRADVALGDVVNGHGGDGSA